MSFNASFKDSRPSNNSFSDTKPVNATVDDTRPKNISVNFETEVYYESTINVGEPMGLLLSLTYPNTFTFQTSFHP